ncbi:MAG: hypothetical protein Q7V63_09690 [Gammaproteobacteria bacterium]|nr:hypothetical protein [Gammaproteobacteria bacterium]
MKRKINMDNKSAAEKQFKEQLLGKDHEIEDEASWESFPASDAPSWSSGQREIENKTNKKSKD